MKTFIVHGTRFGVEAGTDSEPEIVRWSTWISGQDPGATRVCDQLMQSYALFTREGVVLIDPARPMDVSLSYFEGLTGGKFKAVVLTTPWHERDSKWFQARYGTPIYGPKIGVDYFDAKPDMEYSDKTVLPGSIEAVWAGDKTLGEMALSWESSEGIRVLIAGDSVYGQSDTGGFGGVEVRFWNQVGGVRLYRYGLIAEDELRKSFRRLLEVKCDVILNGHNPLPIHDQPMKALVEVVENGTYQILEDTAEEPVCSYLWI